MSKIEQLDQIWVQFRTAVAEAFRTAHEVEQPAGVTPQWQALCARYGVALLPDEERQQVLSAQRPLRGAAAMELHGVIKELCREHRIATKAIDAWDAGSDVEYKHQALLNLIERTERELLDAYRGAVLPKRQGMFGNLFAAGAPQAAAPVKAGAYTLSCRWCGAPRLSDKDFTCAYCGQQMA
jgi:hypothetical protein